MGGTSSDVNVVVFFDQSADADNNLDNSTCWTAAVDCVDSGADYTGPFFMENVNDHRNAKNGNYNIQIANVQNGDVLSIQLNANDGQTYAVQNISVPFGTVMAAEDAWGNQYSDDSRRKQSTAFLQRVQSSENVALYVEIAYSCKVWFALAQPRRSCVDFSPPKRSGLLVPAMRDDNGES